MYSSCLKPSNLAGKCVVLWQSEILNEECKAKSC
jgi:hypothetical protein